MVSKGLLWLICGFVAYSVGNEAAKVVKHEFASIVHSLEVMSR